MVSALQKAWKNVKIRSTDTTSTRARKEKKNRQPAPKEIQKEKLEGVIVCLDTSVLVNSPHFLMR